MYYLGTGLWQIRLLIIYEQSSLLSLPCGRAEWWKHSGGRAEDDHLDGIFRSLLMAPHIILSLPHCHETATSSFFQPTMEPKCLWSRISIFQLVFTVLLIFGKQKWRCGMNKTSWLHLSVSSYGPTYYSLSAILPRNSHKLLLSAYYGAKIFLNSHTVFPHIRPSLE